MVSRLRTLLLLCALVLGAWARLDGVGEVALFGDEFHGRGVGEASLGELLTTFDSVGSHVVTPALQHVSISLLGPGVLSMRLVAIVPGILALLLMVPLAVRLFGERGRTVGVLATAFLALSPMHTYYTRFARGYALLVLLGMLLLWAVAVATDPESSVARRRRSWVAAALCAAALPVVHLSSAGTVALVGLVAIAVEARRGGLRAARTPVVVFVGAAVLALLAFVPVLGQVQDYFAQTRDVKDQPSTTVGILLLLGGGEVGALLWTALFPLGLVLLTRREPRAGLLCAATLAGPILGLAVLRPHGMEYAWARYLLGAIPFVCLVAADVLVRLAHREELALALGALLAIGLGVTGPDRTDEPTATSGSYLAMRSLPAFDEPWPDASPFYRELAALGGDLRIVESPPPLTRASLLFRNLGLKHGHEIRLGWPGGLPVALGGDSGDGPFVDVLSVTAEDADFLVLHRDLVREVGAYWRFVYGTVWPGLDRPNDAGLMKRHETTFIRTQPHVQPQFVADRAARLRERLGPAYYKDDVVLVWKLSD